MLSRVPCVRHLPCSGFVLTKIISVFLESTNIGRVKLQMRVNLRFYPRLFYDLKFENKSPNVDKQVLELKFTEHGQLNRISIQPESISHI